MCSIDAVGETFLSFPRKPIAPRLDSSTNPFLRGGGGGTSRAVPAFSARLLATLAGVSSRAAETAAWSYGGSLGSAPHAKTGIRAVTHPDAKDAILRILSGYTTLFGVNRPVSRPPGRGGDASIRKGS